MLDDVALRIWRTLLVTLMATALSVGPSQSGTRTVVSVGNKPGRGSAPIKKVQFETDVLASESTCKPTGKGCTVPPAGALFYPFYAQSGTGANCNFTFGNDIRGATINDFGRDVQYGTPNLPWFFGTASGGIRPNPCTPHA